jgi:hypothetical protein
LSAIECERVSSVFDERLEQAAALMAGFAERTGLTGGRPSQRRYLWTDAFAVCNFVGLQRVTGDPRAGALAIELVERVHRVLGRYRLDDARAGWISGLDDVGGEARPTLGGLRIGKPLRERADGEGFDDRLESERDGQYFHYLTKWMRALDQLSRAAYEAKLNVWARELADTAHRRFTHALVAGGGKRMYWKMSVDLARPLVPSMGHHDPLDGLLTCLELEDTAAAWEGGRGGGGGPDLSGAVADFASMIELRTVATADPLRVGALLVDVQRVARLLEVGTRRADPALLRALLDALVAAAAIGLGRCVGRVGLAVPAARRLPLRELGLAIGLAAIAAMDRGPIAGASRAAWTLLQRHAPLRDQIEAFWLRPEHRRIAAWTEHADQHDVMLATCLLPDGFLDRPVLAS